MYLQTSRLQYNLQKVGVFQKVHSDKNIQAEACKDIISQKCEQFNHIMDFIIRQQQRVACQFLVGMVQYNTRGVNFHQLEN